MTREEAKEIYNGIPIAFQIIDKIYDAHEAEIEALNLVIQGKDAVIAELTKEKNCDGCIHKPNEGENYLEPCGTCSRFYTDFWEGKDDN
jgi:hypothetical protein